MVSFLGYRNNLWNVRGKILGSFSIFKRPVSLGTSNIYILKNISKRMNECNFTTRKILSDDLARSLMFSIRGHELRLHTN